MRERIEQGKLFTDMCEGLPEERMAAKQKMRRFNDTDPGDLRGRLEMLHEMLGQADEVWIEPPFYFCYGTHIFIGKGTYINFNCNFVDDGRITIGQRVLFGPAVTVATTGHPICPDLREYMYAAPVVVGDNCWIGAGAVICPGVTIGKNSVIGAGSVVTKDIPENSVAAGNPCRVIRKIDERDKQCYFRDKLIDSGDLAEEAALRGGTGAVN